MGSQRAILPEAAGEREHAGNLLSLIVSRCGCGGGGNRCNAFPHFAGTFQDFIEGGHKGRAIQYEGGLIS